MRKQIIITLSLLLIAALQVCAATFKPETQIVNGYYIVTDSGYIFTDGENTYAHVGADGRENWRAVMFATFIYNGYNSKCTYSGCSVTVTDHDFYVASKICGKKDNTATTDLTMGRKVLGVTVAKDDYHFALSCDKDGKLH